MDYVIAKEGVFLALGGGKYQKFIDHTIYEFNQIEIVRKICSRNEIEELLERIEFIQTLQAPSKKIYQEFYNDAMSKYDEIEWVKVIKTAYIRHKMKRIEEFEKEYWEQAKNFLYSEIAILLEIPFDDVEQYIIDYIRQNEWDN